jgi:hypothetical protein
VIDDHSRLFLASVACPIVKAADVAEAFRSAVDLHGAPASLLCDNGAVFTARPRGGKVLLQVEMERLGVIAKNSRPYHPQTCVDSQGTVTLRHDSKLHHIGIGRAHKGRPIKLLIADRDIRILDLDTGEVIRRLTLDPGRDYQPIEGS